MSKRSIRKVRHHQNRPSVPSFKDCVAAGQNGTISLIWHDAGFPERELTTAQKEKLNKAVQGMIDKGRKAKHMR